MTLPNEDRIAATIKGTYGPLIQEILEYRPHLKTKAGVIERALDYYLDSIIRLDKKPDKKEVKENV